VYSLSSTSITVTVRPCTSRSAASAGPMVAANSRSVISTVASQWCICQASSGASSRVFKVLSTALSAGTA
jgi:hypothetical protein